mmetsp:Transcript_18979/g.22597  ORF Transcript_18979/g.22597 Transcript_18979/m.22597 type:complete len:995 (-) Transcript_18979:144-3128(-)
MNTRRKRNTTQSREFVRSSLSESTEALRPSTKRQPNSNAWSTPKGEEHEINFDNLPDPDLVSADDLFDSLTGSLGSLNGSLGNSLSLAPTPKNQKPPPPVPAFSYEPQTIIQQPVQAAQPQIPQIQQQTNYQRQIYQFQSPPPIQQAGIPKTGNGQNDSYLNSSSLSSQIPPTTQTEWGEEEDAVLREGVLRYGINDWDAVSRHMIPSHCRRNASSCERRWSIVKGNVVKGPWLPEEDLLLRDLVGKIGAKKWSVIANSIPGRAGKQCRERWLNHLDSTVKKCDWSEEEDAQLIAAQRMMGNKWSDIAKILPGRAENAVKNRYNSLITKKIAKRTATIAARAEKEFQQEATAEQTRMEMVQAMRGKNVLQQIFSVVNPSVSDETPKLNSGGSGLNLHLDTGSDENEVAIELDLNAPDSDIPVEHLEMTKRYVEQERQRANLFNDVAFSSAEFRNVENLVKGQDSTFFDERGVSVTQPPPIGTTTGFGGNGAGGYEVPVINNTMSPRGNRSSVKTKQRGKGSMRKEVEEEELIDPMDAFRSLSIDQEAWDVVLENSGGGGLVDTSHPPSSSSSNWASPRFSSSSSAHDNNHGNGGGSNIGTRFTLSRNLGSPHHQPHLSDFGLDGSLGASLGNGGSLGGNSLGGNGLGGGSLNGGSLGGGGLDHQRHHQMPNKNHKENHQSNSSRKQNMTIKTRSSGDNSMRLSSSFGTTAANIANNSSSSSSSSNRKKGSGGSHEGEGDPNADSLESRLSGMSIEEEEWKGLDGGSLNLGFSLGGSLGSLRESGQMREPGKSNGNGGSSGGGVFRLSPRDDWVFRTSQQVAAEGAAAAALNGSLNHGGFGGGNNSVAYDDLNESIHHHPSHHHSNDMNGLGLGLNGRAPSPTGSIDEEDWDLLCVMGTTPKAGERGGGSGGNSMSNPGGRISPPPPNNLSIRGRAMPIRRITPPRGTSPPKPSQSSGSMTPRARALMTLNEDYKAGKIDKDEKLRLKERILHSK